MAAFNPIFLWAAAAILTVCCLLVPCGQVPGSWQKDPHNRMEQRKNKLIQTYCPLSLVTSTKTLILILGAGVDETPQEREVTLQVQAKPAVDTYLGRLLLQQGNYRVVSNTGKPGTTGVRADWTNPLHTCHEWFCSTFTPPAALPL